jgi:NTP pyrophosphatase (non-canonical NTP hydrolase)
MKSIRELQKEIHSLAREKGWWDAERSPLEIHMLIVSEVAEATEAVRAGMHPLTTNMMTGKPEGERSELADVVIRILDYYEHRGWNLGDDIELKHSFNKNRAYRHGGKKF